MSNQITLESNAGRLVVDFGNGIFYESDKNPFDFFWFDLWPEQLEIIKNCEVWNDFHGFTFEQLKEMIDHYDEHCQYTLAYSLGEDSTAVDLEQMKHHYLNH